MGFARWGFRPEWSKIDDPAMASKMINARSETVAEKPSFRDSWVRGRRCIIPANGFYEWKKGEDGSKQPYFIQHKDSELLCMAGLWSKVDDQVTFTVLTKQANGELSKLHHRMPVMFEKDQAKNWFVVDVGGAGEMIERATGEQCDAYKVSNAVGKVANDTADLIEPLEAA